MERALLLVVFARHPNRSDLKEAVMQRRQALKLFAGLALCPLCASTGFASEGHWSYEGPTGPEKWGGLDAADAACSAGGQQSPIDITAPISARQPPLRISWSKRPDTIVNNGHTIQLDFAEGDTLHVGDRRYALKQFHFHHPSEHLIEGKRFAMEVHFVHAGTDGLAVIGVLVVASKPNARPFRPILPSIPEGYCRPSVRITTTRDRSRHRRAVRQSTGSYLLTRSRWTKTTSHASPRCTQ
jgi:carbonic anhydrase